jgi:hypothetical protein
MKKYFLCAGLFFSIAGMFGPVEAEPATSVAIYSNGFGVVRQVVTPEPGEGGGYLLRGLPPRILPQSIMLEGASRGRPLDVTEQWLSFEEPYVPLLHWKLRDPGHEGGTATVYYATAGLFWEADYNVALDRENKQIDLVGWATIRNECGSAIDAEHLTLVYAGEPKKAEARPQGQTIYQIGSGPAPSQEAPPSVPALQIPAGSPSYPLQIGTALAHDASKQVKLAEAHRVAYDTFFVYKGTPRNENSGGPYSGMPPRQSPEFNQFSTDQVMQYAQIPADAIPLPLPPGRLQVYERAPQLTLLNTAKLEFKDSAPVEIELGVAQGLSARREQKQFSTEGSNQQMRETMAITLSNSTDAEVPVRIQEMLNRGKQWEITEASNIFQKTSDDSIEFRVQVPASGEITVSYTVSYSRSGSYW